MLDASHATWTELSRQIAKIVSDCLLVREDAIGGI